MASIVSKINEMVAEHGSVAEYLKSLETTLNPYRTMNFKIFFIEEHQTEVCVHRDRNENGDDFVLITAFIPEDDGDQFEEESVTFSSESLIKQYIQDFSQASAESFLKNMLLKEG